MKITIYTDRGHGWAKVSKNLIHKLNINDKISHYSYMRGKTAYLEEDCDLGVLCRALDSHNIKFSFVEKHTDKTSKIRNYLQYRNY